MSQSHDLSAYELVRLENIRKNAEFLAQLGVEPLTKKPKHESSVDKVVLKKKRVKTERDDLNAEKYTGPLRRSMRAHSVPLASVSKRESDASSEGSVDTELQADEATGGIHYYRIPEVRGLSMLCCGVLNIACCVWANKCLCGANICLYAQLTLSHNLITPLFWYLLSICRNRTN